MNSAELGTRSESAGPQTPEALIAQFGLCIRERALDRLMGLYEPDAVFVPEPGVRLTGGDAIRQALAGMLQLSPVMETNVVGSHVVGDIALIVVDWTMRGTAPDGTTVTKGGRSADVLRRQRDGSWRVLIDHP